jgi:hypothetical protein
MDEYGVRMPPLENDVPELLDAAEAAQLLGVDPASIHRQARKGRISVWCRVGTVGRGGAGKALFRREDVLGLEFKFRGGERIDHRLGLICGLCDRQAVDPVEWGALRAQVCRSCSGALDARVGAVLVQRWAEEDAVGSGSGG